MSGAQLGPSTWAWAKEDVSIPSRFRSGQVVWQSACEGRCWLVALTHHLPACVASNVQMETSIRPIATLPLRAFSTYKFCMAADSDSMCFSAMLTETHTWNVATWSLSQLLPSSASQFQGCTQQPAPHIVSVLLWHLFQAKKLLNMRNSMHMHSDSFAGKASNPALSKARASLADQKKGSDIVFPASVVDNWVFGGACKAERKQYPCSAHI